MNLSFRTFLNTDLPALVEVWRRQVHLHRLAARVNQATFEERILSKPYFDPAGLILAFDNERPVGFAHTGFAPHPNQDGLDPSTGIISMLAIAQSHVENTAVADELTQRGIEFMKQRGATSIYFGGRFPDNPFYLGLYGGALVPGILDEDSNTLGTAARAGFQHDGRVLVMQKSLIGFRPQVSRQQMSIGRKYEVVIDHDPRMANWWHACQLGNDQIVHSQLIEQRTGEPVASAIFWEPQPMASSWGLAVMGLFEFQVVENQRRSGLGTYLLCESLREFAKDKLTHVEVHVLESDTRGVQMATKLGFETVASATQWVRRM
ncbi:MAG TPA: GNAT family N-acetyltransferase [Pirellulaceae bacterium]|nr:GNAT family N-acetyltransferase [Pirellulaceae bacterium]